MPDFLNSGTLLLADIEGQDVRSMPLEPRFDRLTRVAREALRVAAAAIAIARDDSFWFKSVAGWDIEELPGKRSLCHLAIDARDLVVIPDTLEDPALARHSLVLMRPHIRFFAGYPLRDVQGRYVGGLCVYDTRPRKLSPGKIQALRDLGAMAQRELFSDDRLDAQRQLVQKLGLARREAMIDPLTRIWNRRAGFQLLQEACSTTSEATVGVGMIDVDYFKVINDTHGHQAGDDVLRKVARRIISAVRDGDIVARYGGDEFLIALRGIAEPDLQRLAEDIRARVQEFPIRTRAGAVPVTLTIGTAFVDKGTDTTPDQIVHAADEALMQLKRARASAGAVAPAEGVAAVAKSAALPDAVQDTGSTATGNPPLVRSRPGSAQDGKSCPPRESRTYHRLQPLRERPATPAGGSDPYDSGRDGSGWD